MLHQARVLGPAALVAVAMAFAVVACDSGGDSKPEAKRLLPSPTEFQEPERVTVRGTLNVDGQPFDAEFLGARVIRDGLVTPCQATIPGVLNGVYEIDVVADDEVRGCGAPGAEIYLWTFIGEEQLHSLETVSWPDAGETITFDASFSSATPQGVAPRTTDIASEVFTRDGRRLPTGVVVEAYVGDVLCGVASTRPGIGAEIVSTGFALAVVAADSVAGCDEGATLTFRVDGELALETAVHDLGGVHLDLTVP